MIKSALQSSLTNDIKYRSMSAGAVPSSEYLITTTVVGATPLSNVVFDVSSYAGVYKHLRLVLAVRTTRTAANNDQIGVTFNGDSGIKYIRHELIGDGSTIVALASGTQDNITLREIETNLNSAGQFNAIDVDILDPFSSTKNTTLRALNGTAGRSRIVLSSGAYFDTAVVTSITLTDLFGTFVTGSRFSLYGVTA